MIFERIAIQNLFSYYGEQVFDNLAPDDGKPVVLISGRNGFGKTSFINSIKLLFLGTTEDMILDAQVGRKLPVNRYLLGVDHQWQGVFNRDAIAQGEQEFGISVDWVEDAGKVSVRRFWTLTGTEPIPHLHIHTNFDEAGLGINGFIQEIEEAEEFLQRRLPREIVPFFFYDGEKIQALAEANEQGRMKQIERLLGLAAVDTLDGFLKNAISEWKRDGTQEIEQAELDKLAASQSLKIAEKAKAQSELQELESELESNERDAKRHERHIASIRSLLDQHNAPATKERADRLGLEYEQVCQRVARNIPNWAPAIANTRIVESIVSKLDQASAGTSRKVIEEMQNVFDVLPSRIFDEPTHPNPPLTAAQKKHYKAKVSAILKQFTEPPAGGYFSLNSTEMRKLQQKASFVLQASSERQRQLDDLRDASRLRREWLAAKNEVENVSELSPDQKKAFEERKAELTRLSRIRDELLQKIGGATEKISSFDTELARLANEISQQETKRVKAGINTQHIRRAEQARKVFDLYSDRLKSQRREEIEIAVNRCFKLLMNSHRQIDSIHINDEFALNYKDKNGRDVGLANVSAGMKQLAAQALLWALSDISGKKVPVIVDTPLARIDRQHQNNLLDNYYPNAAQQVIVLPTDAELDVEKYSMLEPKISREFRLENSTLGGSTTVSSGAKMYLTGEV